MVSIMSDIENGCWAIESAAQSFREWDEWLIQYQKFNFLQLSYRNRSYEAYSQKSELLVYRIDGQIVAGSCNIILSRWPFKAYICIGGVCFDKNINIDDRNYLFEQYIDQIKSIAFKRKCDIIQLSVPSSAVIQEQFSLGKLINSVPSFGQLNLITIPTSEASPAIQEKLLSGFSKKGRRDVRYSLKQDVNVRIARSLVDLEAGYRLIEENSKSKGYRVREWDKFGKFLQSGFTDGTVFMLLAEFNNAVVGSMLLERSSDTLNYTMGGNRRMVPDKLIGYRLQISAMLLCSELGIPFYNISTGGNVHVMNFKNRFNPVANTFNVTYFMFVNNFKGPLLKKALDLLKKFNDIRSQFDAG